MKIGDKVRIHSDGLYNHRIGTIKDIERKNGWEYWVAINDNDTSGLIGYAESELELISVSVPDFSFEGKTISVSVTAGAGSQAEKAR